MKTQTFNLFIIDEDSDMRDGLKKHLEKRFGNNAIISLFASGESALQAINKSIDIVILDYNLSGEDGNEILRKIKRYYPEVEVIMLTTNEDVAVAIQSFRNGASDYVIKGDKAWKKVSSGVLKIITYPFQLLVREFGISKYLAIFLLVFVGMGLGVAAILHYYNWTMY